MTGNRLPVLFLKGVGQGLAARLAHGKGIGLEFMLARQLRHQR